MIVITDDRLPDGLVALQRDGDPATRAVGAAVVRTVTGRFDEAEHAWIDAIESLRADLDASTEQVDTALCNTRGVTKPLVVGEVATKRSKKGLWALVLFALVRELRPERMLELGTCLGVSGAYLAAAAALNRAGTLTSLEGAPALAARAQANLDGLGLRGVEVVPGLFRDTLQPVLDRTGPIDLAFVDGHHDEDATQVYFEQLLAHLAAPAVVVFDDIAWSEGMARAWDALAGHAAVRLAVDLDRIGVCIVGSASPGASRAAGGGRRVALPKLTTIARQVRPPSSAGSGAATSPAERR
ncbi:MAG: class I SAM-dependent methyltransferase [Acidimicrobiales bacterium]